MLSGIKVDVSEKSWRKPQWAPSPQLNVRWLTLLLKTDRLSPMHAVEFLLYAVFTLCAFCVLLPHYFLIIDVCSAIRPLTAGMIKPLIHSFIRQYAPDSSPVHTDTNIRTEQMVRISRIAYVKLTYLILSNWSSKIIASSRWQKNAKMQNFQTFLMVFFFQFRASNIHLLR